MNIFLTGLSGFIAPHLANKLLELGHSVDAVGELNQVSDKMVEAIVFNREFRTVDSFELQRKKYDAVIHLAATTNIKKEFNPDIFFNNIIFAQQVLSTPFRTLYASSTSAYELNNPYSYSKAFNEHLGKRHGNALGLRLFNVYGPGNNKGIVKRIIDCCIKGEPLILEGGDQVRDFIYIDDVVDRIIENFDNKDQLVIDIATGVGTKVIDLVSMIAGIMNVNLEIVFKNNDFSNEQSVSIGRNYGKWSTPLKDGLLKTIEQSLK